MQPCWCICKSSRLIRPVISDDGRNVEINHIRTDDGKIGLAVRRLDEANRISGIGTGGMTTGLGQNIDFDRSNAAEIAGKCVLICRLGSHSARRV